MTNDVNQLFMEQFNVLRDGQRQITEKTNRIETTIRSTNERPSSIDHHVMGIHSSGIRQNDEIDEIKERLNKLEKRFQLIEERT